MRKNYRAIAAAFQFLSRLPVPQSGDIDFSPQLLRQSAKYYPLVGAVIGLVLLFTCQLIDWLLPPMPTAAILLIVWVWLTGGLHLDGWMDTCDALLSYRSRERMLEIMKDSRVGAMGVIACVLLLLLKFSLLSAILQFETELRSAALVVAPIWSRWFMVWAMRFWPAARKNEGLAARHQGQTNRDVLLCTLMAVLMTMAVGISVFVLFTLDGTVNQGPAFASRSVFIFASLAPLLAWLIGTITAKRVSQRLGGLTGDIYGALNEGLEVLLLIVAVAVLS